MNTLYIDCNRSNTDDFENDQTNIWNYKLNKEVRLPPGTQISINNAFINSKGILGSSIEIEKEVTETIYYYVYVTDDFHESPIEMTGGGQPSDPVLRYYNHENLFSATVHPNTVAEINPQQNHGGSQQLFVLYEPYTVDAETRIRPVLRRKTIKINKGIYSINQLNDIINDQVNGKRDTNLKEIQPYEEAVEQKDFFGNLCQYQAGLTANIDPYNREAVIADPTVADDLHAGHVFIKIDDHKLLIENVTNTKEIPYFVWDTFRPINFYAIALDNQYDATDVDNTDYNLAHKQMTIGTTEFKLDYDSEKSGFSLNYLHQPLRIPTHDNRLNSNLNSGQQAVLFRSPCLDALSNETGVAKAAIYSSLARPKTRNTGAIVYNFAYDIAIDNSPYTLSDQWTEYASYTQIISDNVKAKNGWKKSLLYRLGFSYEQLNKSSNFEKIISYDDTNNSLGDIGGITTDQDVDISVMPQLSTKQNPYVDTHSTSGQEVSGFNPFNFIPSNTPQRNVEPVYADNNNVRSYEGSLYTRSTGIYILTSGRPLVADRLPTLSVHGYYTINSDITSGYDLLGKGNPLSLLGVVPKTSLSSQDFISANSDIVNVVTNPKIINSIKIQVLNPDLTNPEISDNSSVIIKLVMPVTDDQGQPIQQQKK